MGTLDIGRQRAKRGVLDQAGHRVQVEGPSVRVDDDVAALSGLMTITPEVSGGATDALAFHRATLLCRWADVRPRSEEHTSELQSHSDLVCRLLLEKKKKK